MCFCHVPLPCAVTGLAIASAAGHGKVTASADAVHWGPMRPVLLRGYAEHTGDVYFFAAQLNPIDRSSLLALFPLSQPPFNGARVWRARVPGVSADVCG